MAKYRTLQTIFWSDSKVIEEMTPDDKLFYIYLLTNSNTKQIGVYQITRKQMAFELGFSIETVNTLIDRFEEKLKLIKYDEKTREVCIINWGKYNLNNSGKPIEDCIKKELKEIKNIDFIKIVYQKIENEKIKLIFSDFIKSTENIELEEKENTERHTERAQKQKEKEKQKEKQQHNKKEKEQYNNKQSNKHIEKDVVAKRNILKNSFQNISDKDIESILNVLNKYNRNFKYLESKINIVKGKRNVENVVGYLIDAIINDYKNIGENSFKNFKEDICMYTDEYILEMNRRKYE